MQIEVTITYTVQRASQATCDRFNKPSGTFEILDADGDRLDFVESLEAAKTAVYDAIQGSGFTDFDLTLS